MPKKELPSRPSLDHVKYQARDLRKALLAGDPEALQRVRESHPRFKQNNEATPPFPLSAAQFVIAREYGFSSWEKLKAFIETVREFASYPAEQAEAAAGTRSLTDEFLSLACLVYGADHPSRREKGRQLFAEHPELGKTDIYTASAIGDVAEVRQMLARDPSLAQAKGGPGRWEPLLYAAYSRLNSTAPGHSTLEVARLLLAHGADPNAGFLWEGFPSPFTALTGIFGEGEAGPVNQPPHQYEEEFARLLLEAGADPNDNQTLYNRMFTRGTRHLELLFSYGLGRPAKGPWPRRLGEKANTPAEMLTDQLHWAAQHNHLDRIQLLIRHGVDLDRLPKNGRTRTAYETALLHGNQEIADCLLQNGARKSDLDPLDAFEAACARTDRAAVLALLPNVPDLLEKLGPRKLRLMADAASQNKQDAVRLMHDLGFPVNNEEGGASPLHQAAWSGHLEMAKLLVELGADAAARDRNYQATPAQWAGYNHHPEVAAYLESLPPPQSALHPVKET